MPWARIDRAAFQYHYYTALPFVVLALAYLAAELWHGPSRRTWAWVRLAGALAIVAPAAMWLFSRPLCRLVGVGTSTQLAGVPGAHPRLPADLSEAAALLLVVAGGALVLGRGRCIRARRRPRRVPPAGRCAGSSWAPPAWRWRWRPRSRAGHAIFTSRGIPVEPIALLVLLPLLYLAGQVIAARDARRFVLGRRRRHRVVRGLVPEHRRAAVAIDGGQCLPGLAADLPVRVPVPGQHGRPDRRAPLVSPNCWVLTVAIAATCLVVAYSASVWRLVLAESGRTRPSAQERPVRLDGLAGRA